jgi:hypothetical protein
MPAWLSRCTPRLMSSVRSEKVSATVAGRPHIGVQRRRAARPAPRGRCTPQNQPDAPPGLGRPSLVRRADPTVPGVLRGHRWSLRPRSCGGTAAWWPRSGPSRTGPAALWVPETRLMSRPADIRGGGRRDDRAGGPALCRSGGVPGAGVEVQLVPACGGGRWRLKCSSYSDSAVAVWR